MFRFFIIVLGFLSLSAAARAAGSDLVGTWNLVSWEARRVTDGSARLPFGKQVMGRMIYDANGNVSTQVSQMDRMPFVANVHAHGRPDEVADAFSSYIAYFGTYTLDQADHSVTHHVRASLFPNWVATNQKRYFEIRGDILKLRTPPLAITNGYEEVHVLTWERMR